MAKKWKGSRNRKKKKSRGSKKAKADKQVALKADIESLWIVGYEHFEAGRYNEAINAWTNLLKLCNSNYISEVQNQDIDIDSLKDDLAEAHYKIAISIPKEEVGRRNSQLSLAVRYNSRRADYHCELGLTRYQSGNYKGAIEAYKKALELAPDEDRLKILSALAYLRDGNTKSAEELLAHVNGSAVVDACRIEAIILTKERKFDASCGSISTIENDSSLSAHHPSDPIRSSYEYLFSAMIQLAANDLTRSIEYLEKCHSCIKELSDVEPFLLWNFYYYRSLACYLTDDISDVRENWKRALEVAPKDKNGKVVSPFADKMSVLANGMIDVCFEHEDFDGAIKWCEESLQLCNDDAYEKIIEKQYQAQIALANHYASQNRLLDAIHLWEAALSIDKGNLDILHNIAAAYDRLEDHRQANIYWNIVVRALKKRFKSSDRVSLKDTKERLVNAYKYLGDNYVKDGEFSQATKQYEAALWLVPDNAKIRTALAKTLVKRRRHNEAIMHFQKILDDDPKNVSALVEMARVYGHRRDDNNAIKYLRKALKLDPYNQNIKQDLADLHGHKGNEHLSKNWYKRALREFEKQSELIPQDYSPLCSIGEIQLEMGERAKARKSFEKAISIAPNNPNAYLRIGKAYMGADHWGEAKQYFDKATEYAKDDETFIEIGLACCSNGHKCKFARSYFDKAIEIGDDETPMKIASDLLDYRCEHAYIYAERGVKLRPEEASRHYTLAYCYFYADRYEDAKNALKKARALADNSDEKLIKAIESFSEYMEGNEDNLMSSLLGILDGNR